MKNGAQSERELLGKLKAEILGVQYRCKSSSGHVDRDRGDRMMALFEAIEASRTQTPTASMMMGENEAVRAMWTVDFGTALLECMEDAKRGVDSSDLVRKAAYRALSALSAPSAKPAVDQISGLNTSDVMSVIFPPMLPEWKAKPSLVGGEDAAKAIAAILYRRYDSDYDAGHLTPESFMEEAREMAQAALSSQPTQQQGTVVAGVVRVINDMNPAEYLDIYRQDDGDLILTISSLGISDIRRSASIELCTSQGGGKNHDLWMALARYYKIRMGEEVALTKPSPSGTAGEGV